MYCQLVMDPSALHTAWPPCGPGRALRSAESALGENRSNSRAGYVAVSGCSELLKLTRVFSNHFSFSLISYYVQLLRMIEADIKRKKNGNVVKDFIGNTKLKIPPLRKCRHLHLRGGMLFPPQGIIKSLCVLPQGETSSCRPRVCAPALRKPLSGSRCQEHCTSRHVSS